MASPDFVKDSLRSQNLHRKTASERKKRSVYPDTFCLGCPKTSTYFSTSIFPCRGTVLNPFIPGELCEVSLWSGVLPLLSIVYHHYSPAILPLVQTSGIWCMSASTCLLPPKSLSSAKGLDVQLHLFRPPQRASGNPQANVLASRGDLDQSSRSRVE